MAKSILASNPSCISNCGEFVLLMAEDRLYLGIGATASQFKYLNDVQCKDSTNESFKSSNIGNLQWENEPSGVGNHQWIIIPMPSSYCLANNPIRFATINQTGQHIAIAGKNGFALYSMVSKKWKLFGNETQEKDFEVCGGLVWYKDYIVMGCFNIANSKSEVRVYPQKEKLDNHNAKIVEVPCDILLMSIHKNRLLVYLIDGSFYLFSFFEINNSCNIEYPNSASLYSSNQYKSTNSSLSSSSLHFILMHQIIINNLIIPPNFVNSIVLSTSHLDNHQKQLNDPYINDIILINVCGRLFLFEVDYQDTSNLNIQKNGDSKSSLNDSASLSDIYNPKIPLVYKAVSILASDVENVWVNNSSNDEEDEEKRPHLKNALWLACGLNGMSVWLPLLSRSNENSFLQSKSFIAKRIMLPINTHIYPLAVQFRNALVLGAENDTILCGKSLLMNKPFSIVSKTSQVYLHHILRELLRRNLGNYAWEIANSCSSLPYFPHSLELLLHEVLEEEATSSQAIPDPLLPRVILFIREFSVFLETVVHCARKTELALWPHLFSVVGNPKDLFQQCLDSGRLSTAASYIIVLHNLEKTSISKQYATSLIEIATEKGAFELVKDLLRFLNAIEPSEGASFVTNKVNQNLVGTHPSKYLLSSSNLVNNSDINHVMSHNQLIHLNQLNFGKSTQTTGRKRTQSSSSTLMLQHSSSINVPQSQGNFASNTNVNGLSKSANSLNNSLNGGQSISNSNSINHSNCSSTKKTAQKTSSNSKINLNGPARTNSFNNEIKKSSPTRRHSLTDASFFDSSACKLQ